MLRVRLFFLVVTNLFNFAKHLRQRRERIQKERYDERTHQLLLLEGFMTKLVDFAKANNDAVIQLAGAQGKMAEAFTEWIKGYTMPVGANAPMGNAVTATDDVWQLPDGTEIGNFENFENLPPEFHLAASLQKLNQQALGDFDREGSDF